MELRPLEHVQEPNLIKEIFPHSIPPLIRFEDRIRETIDGEEVEFDPRSMIDRDIHITDTTFRDGQQSRPPYTRKQMTRIFSMLSKLGGSHLVTARRLISSPAS